jgi:hypothetical protein
MGWGEIAIVGDVNEIWQQKEGEDQDGAATWPKGS